MRSAWTRGLTQQHRERRVFPHLEVLLQNDQKKYLMSLQEGTDGAMMLIKNLYTDVERERGC